MLSFLTTLLLAGALLSLGRVGSSSLLWVVAIDYGDISRVNVSQLNPTTGLLSNSVTIEVSSVQWETFEPVVYQSSTDRLLINHKGGGGAQQWLSVDPKQGKLVKAGLMIATLPTSGPGCSVRDEIRGITWTLRVEYVNETLAAVIWEFPDQNNQEWLATQPAFVVPLPSVPDFARDPGTCAYNGRLNAIYFNLNVEASPPPTSPARLYTLDLGSGKIVAAVLYPQLVIATGPVLAVTLAFSYKLNTLYSCVVDAIGTKFIAVQSVDPMTGTNQTLFDSSSDLSIAWGQFNAYDQETERWFIYNTFKQSYVLLSPSQQLIVTQGKAQIGSYGSIRAGAFVSGSPQREYKQAMV